MAKEVKTKKVKTHKSYHASGWVNMDHSGKSGTSHEHPNGKFWEHPSGIRLVKDNNGVWRTKDGQVFRGGKNE